MNALNIFQIFMVNVTLVDLFLNLNILMVDIFVHFFVLIFKVFQHSLLLFAQLLKKLSLLFIIVVIFSFGQFDVNQQFALVQHRPALILHALVKLLQQWKQHKEYFFGYLVRACFGKGPYDVAAKIFNTRKAKFFYTFYFKCVKKTKNVSGLKNKKKFIKLKKPLAFLVKSSKNLKNFFWQNHLQLSLILNSNKEFAFIPNFSDSKI
ncbi:hypothetical protein BpHYR1_025484 [Brachionus plicatilis]|uniref:Transmembrane protein n=1 Tax=Brachionus plicatilis TaxID=10195 RepID=A0A3M7PBV4_BRAPC|nr:hypothetical protein BpHYR1_025484 [Brachionus plicatilis]